MLPPRALLGPRAQPQCVRVGGAQGSSGPVGQTSKKTEAAERSNCPRPHSGSDKTKPISECLGPKTTQEIRLVFMLKKKVYHLLIHSFSQYLTSTSHMLGTRPLLGARRRASGPGSQWLSNDSPDQQHKGKCTVLQTQKAGHTAHLGREEASLYFGT